MLPIGEGTWRIAATRTYIGAEPVLLNVLLAASTPSDTFVSIVSSAHQFLNKHRNLVVARRREREGTVTASRAEHYKSAGLAVQDTAPAV